MLKTGIIIATLLVATEGLKCNKCFYMEGDDVPDFSDGQNQAGFKFDRSCDWTKDVKSSYSGVECRKIGNVDPVCLVWRHMAPSGLRGHLVLRSCYNQLGGVEDNELNSCYKKGLLQFMAGSLNQEIPTFINSLISTFKNQTLINQGADFPTDVCPCNGDNCNSGSCVGDNCNGGASSITASFLIVAAAGSLLYSFS